MCDKLENMLIKEVYKKIILTTAFFTFFLQFSSASRRRRQIIFEDERKNLLINANCRTPDRLPGRCLRLTSCPALLQSVDLYRMRRYFCGFESDEPRVCCPQSGVEITTNGPRADVQTTVQNTRRPIPTRFYEQRNRGRPGSDSIQNPRPNTMNRPPFLPRTCGIITSINAMRIIGSPRAVRGSWPWMAILIVKESDNTLMPDCGGTLVTNQHVVTAAHCVVTGKLALLEPSSIIVRLGAFHLAVENEPGAIEVEVEEVRPHEQFDSDTYKNDIAVLKLKRTVPFTDTVYPVCLPYDSLRGEDLTDKPVFVIGYGTRAFSDNSVDVLKQATFYIQSREVCKEDYEPDEQINGDHLCAAIMDGSKNACKGDSGGPLLTIGKNKSYYLIGIESFGKQCGQSNYSEVYTKVTAYLDWLAVNLDD